MATACAGEDHSAAVTQSGTLYVWGDNSHGQLGLGHRRAALFPTAVEYPFSMNHARRSLLSAPTRSHPPSACARPSAPARCFCTPLPRGAPDGV